MAVPGSGLAEDWGQAAPSPCFLVAWRFSGLRHAKTSKIQPYSGQLCSQRLQQLKSATASDTAAGGQCTQRRQQLTSALQGTCSSPTTCPGVARFQRDRQRLESRFTIWDAMAAPTPHFKAKAGIVASAGRLIVLCVNVVFPVQFWRL